MAYCISLFTSSIWDSKVSKICIYKSYSINVILVETLCDECSSNDNLISLSLVPLAMYTKHRYVHVLITYPLSCRLVCTGFASLPVGLSCSV